jgi:tetratricopeptide (TPR) repeat protein
VLQRSLELAPENAPALAGTAALQLARHDFAAALVTAQRAVELSPASYASYGLLGDALTELGRYPEAVDAFQQMVDRRPDLTSLSRVSYARELHGDLAGAIDAMRRAADAGAPATEGTAWARIQLGNLYFVAGDLEAAETQYGFALAMLPEYAHAQAGLARVAAARGDLKMAADLYTKSLQAVPWPAYAIELGDVYRAMGNERAAAQQDNLVRVIGQLQRAGGVDVDLEMALFEADHAKDPAALSAAVEAARATYARRPSVHAADVLAWTLYRAGRTGEALPYAREALRLDSKDPLMLFHAGAIAAAAGQPAEARGYLDAALAQNAHFSVRYAPEAEKLLATLRKAGA